MPRVFNAGREKTRSWPGEIPTSPKYRLKAEVDNTRASMKVQTVPIRPTFMKRNFVASLAITWILDAALTAHLSAATLSLPLGGLAAEKSGHDVILQFLSTSPDFYTVQSSPNLLQQWTNLPPGIQGDGTVKTLTLSNAIPARNGLYRLLIQTPTNLLLPQSLAFAILGHWCGGIRERAYVTGFDQTSGYPTGTVYLSTTCSTGGRGSPSATFSAWAAVSWDFAGNVIFSTTLSNAPIVNPTLSATDMYGDVVYNIGTSAYLVVPLPSPPGGLNAVQSGDQFQVSWRPQGVNPAAVTSSKLTAVPLNSTASILSTTVTGTATTGVISSLQPATTYQITVVNTTISGSGSASTPIALTTSTATTPPSAPTGVVASWASLDPLGATDSLVATWQAAVPGDSPIDQYRITIVGSDAAGAFTQNVSGTTLTASFTVDYIPNWSVTVQAHNSVGWGPLSDVFTLGGL